MDRILTKPVPRCIRCGTDGDIYQQDVHDPDGMIPDAWSYRRCSNPDCRLVWLDPAPLPDELWKAYAQYHTHGKTRSNGLSGKLVSLTNRLYRGMAWPVWAITGLYRETRRMRLLMLDQLPAGSLLDVGCGGGRYLRRMQRKGWRVTGIDFDEQATRRVRERYGIDTHTGDLIDARLPTASFDAITMSHSIEHLPDPAATLRECLRLLKPGGHLVVVTPNVESRAASLFGACWRGWEPPRHLFLFSTGTLRQFLLDAGFVVDEARSCAAASAIVYRVSRILQKNGSASTWFRLKLIPWAYSREMEDFKAQRKGQQVAQNVLAIATKPAY